MLIVLLKYYAGTFGFRLFTLPLWDSVLLEQHMFHNRAIDKEREFKVKHQTLMQSNNKYFSYPHNVFSIINWPCLLLPFMAMQAYAI